MDIAAAASAQASAQVHLAASIGAMKLAMESGGAAAQLVQSLAPQVGDQAQFSQAALDALAGEAG